MSELVLLWLIIFAVILLPIAAWFAIVKISKIREGQARNRYFRQAYFQDMEDTLREYQQCQPVDVLPRMTLSSALFYMLGLMDFHFAAKEHERVRINALVLSGALKEAEKAPASDFPNQVTKLAMAFTTLRESADRYLR